MELSELHSQIKTKFPNIFILKKSSAFCWACKTNISLLGRNVKGNLVQHVKSSGHLHNAGKGDATSARDIASFLCPSQRKHLIQLADKLRSMLQGKSYVKDST